MLTLLGLKHILSIYKKTLFSLPRFNSILYLLFYATDEPDQKVIDLLRNLITELPELNSNETFSVELNNLLLKNPPEHLNDLYNEIYNENKTLFSQMSENNEFINMLSTNDTI